MKENMEDPFEAEETLSFSDLLLHGSDESDSWDGSSKDLEDPRSSSFDNAEFFEFFSEDFTASSKRDVADDIIFCGKLIPQKQPVLHLKTHTFESQPKQRSSKKGIFPWKSHSFSGAKPTPRGSKNSSRQLRSSKSISLPVPKNLNMSDYEFSRSKVSVLGSTAKPKWYLFVFGLAKFPPEMDLRDMKMRQSYLRSSATMPRPPAGAENGNRSRVRRRRKTALWGILGVLGCKSRLACAVA